ncbi:hypothetical protein ABKN59_008972 [Abortiporus biennis]
MSVLDQSAQRDSTENWDDDFEFNPAHHESHEKQPEATRRSTTSTQFNEDWDDDQIAPLTKDKKNTITPDSSLQHWAEPGPSTPSRHVVAHTENWDDDFQDKSDSPLRQHSTEVSPRSRRTRVRPAVPEPENWDDEFEIGDRKVGSPSGKSTRWESSSSSDEEFGFAEREDDRTVTSRSRRPGTSSSHGLGDTPPPPVPPIPSSFLGSNGEPGPFPRSPTASVFSVPHSSTTGGRDSVAYSYGSTAHLALRPTTSGSSFSALPPSPPIHRERRRLRKKSRPPRVDDNIYELVEPSAPSRRPVTPERPRSPPPVDISHSDNQDSSDPPPTSPPTRNSLVSRIGSVGKKWGAARKKRLSTGPTEVTLQEQQDATPRASGPGSPSTRASWFFRHGGGLGSGSGSPPSRVAALRSEKSVDRLLAMVESPSKRKEKQKADDFPVELSELLVEDDHVSTGMLFGNPRRPTSMAIPPSSSGMVVTRAGTRHASYGHHGRDTPSSRDSSRSGSRQRSASASVEDGDGHGKDKGKDKERERDGEGSSHPGSRSFMGGMRRISLTTKHKRTKSNAGHEDLPQPRPSLSSPPLNPLSAARLPVIPPDREHDATPRPHCRLNNGRPSIEEHPNEDDNLLPPIELQPPSPPKSHVKPPSALALSYSAPTPSTIGIDALFEQSGTSSATAPPDSAKPPSSPPRDIPSPTRPKPPGSPQAASLGRTTQLPKALADRVEANGSTFPRRNSLGDLKIPARISQAQVGLKRDLTMVREFATSVEQLKQLQTTYHLLVSEVQAMLVATAPPDPSPSQSRAISPTFFNLPRPGSRARSNTNPQTPSSSAHASAQESHRQTTSTYHLIESKYRLSWECAELLIELGGGPPATSNPSSPPISSPNHSMSPTSTHSQPQGAGVTGPPPSRERAITLAGDEPKPHNPIPSGLSTSHSTGGSALHSPPLASPPNPSQWRASTGRHDLSQRQLHLLREMLNNTHDWSSTSYAHTIALGHHISEEEVNRSWRWGDAMSSTITLPPSEESSNANSHSNSGSGAAGRTSPMKKRRSRLGMRGLRDMLKSLKKTYSENHHNHRPSNLPLPPSRTPEPSPLPAMSSASVSASTESSLNLPRPHSVIQRRRAKTSTGPESSKSLRDGRHPNSPYGTSSLQHKSSPRRPSLASIFRLGQKSKPTPSSSSNASPASGPELELSAEDMQRLASGSSTNSHGVDEEEWDRVDSISDLDQELANRVHGLHFGEGSATVRGKKGRSPYLQQTGGVAPEASSRRTPNPSLSSIWGRSSGNESPQKSSSQLQSPPTSAQPDRQSRRVLSKSKNRASGVPSPSPKRPPSRSSRKGHGYSPELQADTLPQLPPPPLPPPTSGFILAMTPENIKPLLENAREVHAKCNDCIGELRDLLAARRLIE